jgi:hypothetical protein
MLYGKGRNGRREEWKGTQMYQRGIIRGKMKRQGTLQEKGERNEVKKSGK